MKLADYSAYIFDMDGTLVDSAPHIMACLRQAFVRVGYEVPSDLFAPEKVGPPIRQIISDIAPETKDTQTQEDIVSAFREIYDFSTDDPTPLYPKIREFLQTLQTGGKKLFVSTFKPQIPTFRLLKQLELNCFADVYTIDKYPQPLSKQQMILQILEKYALPAEQTVMFGDTESDLSAAKQAKVAGVACLWGYGRNKKELEKMADFTFNSPEELLK